MTSDPRAAILALALLAAVIAIFVWLLIRQVGPAASVGNQTEIRLERAPSPSASIEPAEQAPPPETPAPYPEPSPTIQSPISSNSPQQSYVGAVDLLIPVQGVGSDQLLDTFEDARSEGRVHDAIDIPAPAGSPVLAAADGKIIKLLQSERGGTTIYQLSQDRKLVFYYAHLQRYAEGLVEGGQVKRGDVVAYVGDTGNAGVGNYHLHFSVAVVADPKRYWEGTNINPYPLLRR